MSREAVSQIMDRWTNDPTFKEELRADPEATIRGNGYELSHEEWEALRSLDFTLPDEELLQRSSKGFIC